MANKYKYTGRGTLTFHTEDEAHTVSAENRIVQTKRKLTKEEQKKAGLVPVEKDDKSINESDV